MEGLVTGRGRTGSQCANRRMSGDRHQRLSGSRFPGLLLDLRLGSLSHFGSLGLSRLDQPWEPRPVSDSETSRPATEAQNLSCKTRSDRRRSKAHCLRQLSGSKKCQVPFLPLLLRLRKRNLGRKGNTPKTPRRPRSFETPEPQNSSLIQPLTSQQVLGRCQPRFRVIR